MILNKKGACVIDTKREQDAATTSDTKKEAHATVKKHLDACAAAHTNQEVAPAMDSNVLAALDKL